MDRQRFVDWAFGHYLAIAPPEFALEGARPLHGDVVRRPALAAAGGRDRR
jgi:hypothetical protein